MKTLGQKRAAFALEQVSNAMSGMKEKEEFKNFTAGVPSMILMNGFGQTLAFMVAKNDQKHSAVFNMIKAWLTKDNLFVNAASEPREFMLNISNLDQKQYLAAQKEALAFLEWVKRFAAMESGGNK